MVGGGQDMDESMHINRKQLLSDIGGKGMLEIINV